MAKKCINSKKQKMKTIPQEASIQRLQSQGVLGLLVASIAFLCLGVSCATTARVPCQPPDSKPYAFSAEDEALICLVFGDGFLQEVRPCVYTLDLGNPVYKAAYIPSRNEIWLNSNIRIEPTTLLHEATHYYQKNRLGREMSTKRVYDLPSSFTVRMDIEQEAMLVMAYASLVEPSVCGQADHPLPPLRDALRYLRAFMALNPAPLASDGDEADRHSYEQSLERLAPSGAAPFPVQPAAMCDAL
jgi:hypothetical protein